MLDIPTSEQWSKYATFKFANAICLNTVPDDLFVDILIHSHPSINSTRQSSTRIFTSFHSKVGANIFVNRVSKLLEGIKLDVTVKNSRTAIRNLLQS